jgi:hypothetical protein
MEELRIIRELGAEHINALLRSVAVFQPPTSVVADNMLNLVYEPHHDEKMEETGMDQ